MTDRPEVGESAFLVVLQFYPAKGIHEDLNELKALVTSAGFSVAGEIRATLKTPDPRYLVGSGKVNEIRLCVTTHHASLVIVSHPLSPAQQRNLEKAIGCRVMDRTELILMIFARRARSHEGKLQVELAMLKHQATRLVRGWTHLERQRGGIGLRGGPGETQLETDRRLIRARMREVSAMLEKVRAQRAEGRKSRQRAALPTVALVGYTNAGKSTLFNRLTGAKVIAANQLFATLDPTLRRILLPGVGPVIVADTVGFIRDLPPTLIEAFRATLEEVTEAALLLHVVDVGNPDRQLHLASVEKVLKEIGAGKVPALLVYNKSDRGIPPEVVADEVSPCVVGRLFVSAQEGIAIDGLCQEMARCLTGELIVRQLVIRGDQASLLARFYQQGAVQSVEEASDGNLLVTVRLSGQDWQKFDNSFSKGN